MDSIGLLGSWIAVISFLFAILVAIGMSVLTPIYERIWILTSRKRSESYMQRLRSNLEQCKAGPDNAHLAALISLYGSMILNLIAAVGLLVTSIEMLDLAPAILSATLPFDIDPKMLTRITGILTIALSYYFILRLSYLGTQLRLRTLSRRPEDITRLGKTITQLQARLGSRP
jgi:hypothetical protein